MGKKPQMVPTAESEYERTIHICLSSSADVND